MRDTSDSDKKSEYFAQHCSFFTSTTGEIPAPHAVACSLSFTGKSREDKA